MRLASSSPPASSASCTTSSPSWYSDLWLTVVWVVDLLVYLGTVMRRTEPHIYVANWFYLAFILTIAVLHLGNNAAVPVSLFSPKSYIVWSGVQDAMVQCNPRSMPSPESVMMPLIIPPQDGIDSMIENVMPSGMATFEGPMMSVKAQLALPLHRLDHWTRSFRRARLGRLHLLRSDLLPGAMAVEIGRSISGERTLLDEIERLLDRAVKSKSRYVRLSDRAARLYAPFVHTTAALTLIGWLVAGAMVHDPLIAAITVLIITCPCALALAVPAVQVVAARRLFRSGVILNSGDAIERLAEVDTVVFDKTGTLTLPQTRVANAEAVPPDLLELAARLALSSRHPLAQAVAREAEEKQPFAEVIEDAGEGVRTVVDGVEIRLGSLAYCGLDGPNDVVCAAASAGASLMPSPTIRTRRPFCLSSLSCVFDRTSARRARCGVRNRTGGAARRGWPDSCPARARPRRVDSLGRSAASGGAGGAATLRVGVNPACQSGTLIDLPRVALSDHGC